MRRPTITHLLQLRDCSIAIAAMLLLLSFPVSAQDYRATLDGRITDNTGAAVSGAAVSAVNVAGGTPLTAVSSAEGRWTLLYVLPATYTLRVSAQGFKTHVREGIRVHVNDLLTLNIPLEVGELQQSVTVSGETPLLSPESSSLGLVVPNKVITEMPLNGRNVLTLTWLVPGVLPDPTVASGGVRPYDASTPNVQSTNGAPKRSNMFLLNGTWNKAGIDTSLPPSVDSVEEFKVQSNPYDAGFGHVAGGIVNAVTKSGTNDLHGNFFEFFRSSVLDANTFFANKAGLPINSYHYNQFGATAGGPVMLPRFDGRNRAFWFISYEGVRENKDGGTMVSTVPTAGQRQGDFSATKAAGGVPVTIYDPLTVAGDPARQGQYVRQPFAGNMIPQNRLNPVAVNVMRYYPESNALGNSVTGQNNFVYALSQPTTYHQLSGRIDLNIGAKGRLSLTGGHMPWETTSPRPNQSGNASGLPTDYATLDYVRTITPQIVIDANYGFQRANQYSVPLAGPFDVASLGFPRSMTSGLAYQMFPSFGISDAMSMGVSGVMPYWVSEGHNLNVIATRIAGRHSMKAGMLLLILRENCPRGAISAGSYSFDTTWTQADPLNAAKASGLGLASFLLGLPSSGSVQTGMFEAGQRPYWEFFFQDDFKVTPRLTLNLGLRWEYTGSLTDRYNRLIRDFDYTVAQPIQAAAQAAYAKSPIPQVPVDQFRVTGAPMFAGRNGAPRAAFNNLLNNFAPRAGAAYRASGRMVLRAGVGVFYAVPATAISWSGFNGISNMVVSADGIRPMNYLNNPFPNGLVYSVPSQDAKLDSLLGTSLSFTNPNTTNSTTYNYSAGFEYELPGQTVASLSYVGSSSGRFNPGWNFNAYDVKYLGLGSQLNKTVNNPFLGLIPASTGRLGLSSVTLSQLLLPYPEYTGVTGNITGIGHTNFNSLQVLVRHRMKFGFDLTGAYTYSKSMDRNSFLNSGYSDYLESVVDPMDFTQRLVVNGIWEIPFGRGKTFANSIPRWVDHFAGGWELSAIYTAQSGAAMSGPGSANATGQKAGLSSGQSIDRWFNTQAFAVQPAFTLRTLSSRLADVRLPGMNNWDAALMKNFSATERVKVQFRAEFFNTLNRVMLGGPNASVTSAAFGTISSQQNAPRQLQFGLKLRY